MGDNTLRSSTVECHAKYSVALAPQQEWGRRIFSTRYFPLGKSGAGPRSLRLRHPCSGYAGDLWLGRSRFQSFTRSAAASSQKFCLLVRRLQMQTWPAQFHQTVPQHTEQKVFPLDEHEGQRHDDGHEILEMVCRNWIAHTINSESWRKPKIFAATEAHNRQLVASFLHNSQPRTVAGPAVRKVTLHWFDDHPKGVQSLGQRGPWAQNLRLRLQTKISRVASRCLQGEVGPLGRKPKDPQSTLLDVRAGWRQSG